MQFLNKKLFFMTILLSHTILPSQVLDWYKKGQEVNEKLGPDATYKDYFDLYISDWKKIVQQLDWEKLKLYLQEEMGMSRAGEIATITQLPASIQGKAVLSATEQQVIDARKTISGPALYNLTGLTHAKDLTIAVTCAGGGYTGMLTATSFLSAMEQEGFSDAVSYHAASSGATWAVGAVNILKSPHGPTFSYTDFKAMLEQKMASKNFNWFGLENFSQAKQTHLQEFLRFLQTALWPKMVFGQIVSSIDFLGYLLAQFLLTDFAGEKYDQHLSYVADLLKGAHGACPWPLFTAIAMQKDEQNNAGYQVYEFNPREVRNTTLNLGFELFGFDKRFKNGSTAYATSAEQRLVESRDISPEENIGFMLGMFGSKHTASWQDIKHLLLGDQSAQSVVGTIAGQASSLLSWDNATQLLGALKQGTQTESKEMISKQISKIEPAFLVKAIDSVGVYDKQFTIGSSPFVIGGTLRISPAQIRNPFNLYPAVAPWLRLREYLTFVDASFFYDVPLLPVLSPERKVDLVIVCDPYGDDKHMDVAFAHVRQLKNISYLRTASGEGWRVYEPVPAKASMVLIQNFPVIIRLYPAGDTVATANAANPFNFSYTQEQFTQLDAACKKALQDGMPVIKNALREIVHTRTKEKVAGFGG